MNKEISLDILKGLRDYAWNYFQMHASQRLTTFNFYIVISSLLTTALFSSFQKENHNLYFSAFSGLLLCILSFAFWKLDCRNKFLIKQSENALKYFEMVFLSVTSENNPEPQVYQIFMNVEYLTEMQSRRACFLWERNFSYSDCFNLVFIAFSVAGLLASIVLVVFR
jgi:hypothetical protein